MEKNKLNYKLINLCLIFFIFLIVYITRNFFYFIFDILKPIILSLCISYIFNLYLKKLNMVFNKFFSIVVFLFTIFFLGFIFYYIFGQIVEQIGVVYNYILFFFKDFFLKYDLDFFYDKINSFTFYLPKIFNNFLNFISFIIITISSSIYIFIDFNKFKVFFKELSFYSYLKVINDDLESYVFSFFLLSFINFIEYFLIFKLIGHPNFLLLSFCSCVFSLVPIFGGIITNFIAIVTAFIVDYRLFIRTLIGILILTILDGYVVGPIVYSRSNKIHPLLVIFSIYVGGKFMGIWGIIFSLPILIIILSFYKFFKKV